MAGLFSRLKIWNPDETLSSNDLNAEFNNFLANIDAVHSEGFSQNLTQMQTEVDPGDLGSENLTQPISTADEIQRLRFVIARILGLPYWYQEPAISLEEVSEILDGVADVNPSRVISGKTTTLTTQPNYLLADGSSGISIDGTTTNLTYYVDGSFFTLSTNAVLSALNPAPSSQNTALLTSVFSGDQASKQETEFSIGTVGTNITSNIGILSAFKIVDGSNTEYFIGTPTASGTIAGIARGFTFDQSGVNNEAIALTTGETITLLQLSYVFLSNTFTLDATYNPIIYSPTAPSAPSAGDYWYDIINRTWKKFVLGSWVASNSVFVGICAQDAAGDTLFSRSADFFQIFENLSTVTFDSATVDTISTAAVPLGFQSSVYGKTSQSLLTKTTLTMPSDLIPGETELSSTTYYAYVDRNQKFYLSSIGPIERNDILGLYHPAEALVAVASIFNDSSGDFDAATLTNLGPNAPVIPPKVNSTYTILTSGSGTYTTPNPAPYYLHVRMVGGGGGGSGSSTNGATGGAGGGGGGYCEFKIYNPATSYSYAIGAGGTAGVINGSGGIGGDTTFDSYSADGGDGGSQSSTTISFGGYGGTGSVVAGTGFVCEGQGGAAGSSIVTTGTYFCTGGTGGSSLLGAGARGSTAPVSAGQFAPPNSGGGGAGGSSNSSGSGMPGGAGGSGIIIIEEIYQ